ncbi:YSIRK-type signal peptide-containing protein [Lactobacillus mulieris]|uniref:YSIRK-type signal peptide-containing protein n=1 Tax=Lactobacillus mulieris TaxID=2508708 RepID=A0AAW5WZ88_9LACO|nr:YSIRK-type signal peptide-containing protein [Lactobacillus mulieris]MCZ3622900.1 YSIRK-type signal peptide-containing protein [Lactobacillus mulieris]MCZ3624580.1 YSIRK-type signal peptide-containing protein [Lactobacillus mulieris]MCZ3636904.1 YSIRK-type signal peptide-containing protein [Lactobacillus mulieris]MCZ3690859.1 YSIRK-type signal peptide-containing protein [Lactobacillus mulieris]MCZ3696864.1 YSIRK-type signal peptide-containing protein [Lactobacillus mulieris]
MNSGEKKKSYLMTADRQQHFSLRKINVGLASVVLGTSLYLGISASYSHVYADNITNTQTNSNLYHDELDDALTVANYLKETYKFYNANDAIQSELNDALKQAELARSNSNNQLEINSVTERLEAATRALNGRASDKTALKSEIEIAEAAHTLTTYINASKQVKENFDVVLNSAKKQSQQEEISQKQLDSITESLRLAIASLDGQVTNKKDLVETIEFVNAIKDLEIYTNSSIVAKTDLDTALEEAIVINERNDATQAEVDEMVENLNNKVESLSNIQAQSLKKPKKVAIPVGHQTNLTSSEKESIIVAVKIANSNVDKVIVDEVGNVKVVFTDGSVANLLSNEVISDVDKESLDVAQVVANELKSTYKFYNAEDAKQETLLNLLTKAEAILTGSEKDTASQASIDEVTNQLELATRSLDGTITNKKTLEDNILIAEAARDLDKYLNASEQIKNNFDKALKDAVVQRDNSDASQVNVDQVSQALNQAIESLDGQATDKKSLQELVTTVQAFETLGDVYDAASVNERNQLNEALQQATQTLDESSSQAEVDQSEKELETAFWALGENDSVPVSNSVSEITDSKAETVKQDEKEIISESELTQSVIQLSEVKEIPKPKVEKEIMNNKMKIQKKQIVSGSKVTNSKRLPQTGNLNQTLSLVGVLTMLIAMVGLKRRK